MANNKIQIKRSTSNATVTGLSNGELAFTQAGNILYIGAPDGSSGSIRIGGQMVPGTLTANQALVANSTSGIDKVITANLAANTIWANGSAGSSGQLLTSNGTVAYWSTPAASVTGSDTQVQYNDGGSLAAAAGLTFAKASNNVTVANTLLIGGAVNAASHTVGSSFIANSTAIVGTGYANVTTSVNSAALTVGSSIIANTTRLALGTAVGLQVNGTIGTAGQILYSNGTTGYWAAAPVGTVTSVDSGNGLTGGPITGSGTLAVGAGNGISVSADAVAVTGGTTLTVNTTGVHVNSTLSIQDLTLSGNLTVLGDLVTMNVATLAVEDSLITLAKDQGSTGTYTDALDIGFVGTYGNTANLFYSGLYRDQSDSGIWKLFASNGAVSNTVVDTANTNAFKLATLQSYLLAGGLVANATVTNITANSSLSVALVANTLSLTTALPGTSGGTGLSTIANNSLIFGNSTNGFGTLALGTSGYVLQSNGTAIVYDVLDGGTF